MSKRLPGINFQAPVATDDLEFQQTSVAAEIQERTRLVMQGRYGIVDDTDPKNISINALGRALNVVPSATGNPLEVDVLVGRAVTAGGNWVSVESKIYAFELAVAAAGAENVIYVEYALEDSKERRLNTFNVDVAVRQQRPSNNSDVVKVTTLSKWNNSSLFPPDKKDDIVVLALVTVNQLANGVLDSTIDLSNSNLPENRPWYSPVDVEHRNKVGTADPTDNNPHGTSLNDLAAGRLTLYQQVISNGLVLSKDIDVPRYPGAKTSDSILAASFQTDVDGSATRGSALYGGMGAKWANLKHFPVRVGSVYRTGFPAIQVAADFVQNSNILVLPADEAIPEEGVTVEYMFASAGEGPVNPPTNDLTFLQPTGTELIISDGIAVDAIAIPLISFDGSGPIPRDFRVLINADSELISIPQILMSPTKLDAITGQTAITRGLQGDAPIEVGLTRANDVSGMEISIALTGMDVEGNQQSVTVTFTDDTWSDTAIPAASENVQQFVRTEQVFKTLDSIEILSRVGDGNDSTIIIYGDQEAAVTATFQELCPLADVFWDGLAVDTVADSRPVAENLHLPSSPSFNSTAKEATATAWLYEDFSNPRFRDSFKGHAQPNAAIGSIVIEDNTLLQDGDTISFGDIGNGAVTLIAKKPLPATGALSALDIGINVPPSSVVFEVDESPAGGPASVTVSVTTGAVTPDTLANQIASELNANVSSTLTYSCAATPQREFYITATGLFNISASPLGTLIALLPDAGSNNYLGNSLPGIADGDLFTLNDGSLELTFEFDTDGGTSGSNIPVGVLPNALAASVRGAMVAAISSSALDITATDGTGVNILLENNQPGFAGNVTILQSISTGSTMNPVGMSGGSDGGAQAELGEYNLGVGTDADATVQSIIDTLADATFASQITGAATTTGTQEYPTVSLARDVTGVLNNKIVTTSASGVLVTGFKDGTAYYIGISPDAFAEGLRTRIPAIGEDTDLVRKKYRTRAIAVPASFIAPVTKIQVVLHNPINVSSASVLVRAATTTDTNNWQPHTVMTLTASNPHYVVFEHEYTEAVHKIQFEMFGQFTDFTVYDIS